MKVVLEVQIEDDDLGSCGKLDGEVSKEQDTGVVNEEGSVVGISIYSGKTSLVYEFQVQAPRSRCLCTLTAKNPE